MLCSLMILSSVAAPLILFITSKLIIPNIQEIIFPTISCEEFPADFSASSRVQCLHLIGAMHWE